MTDRVARGLAADWLNAWLAAVGVTVLVPNVRLGWTKDAVPLARFTFPDDDLATLISNHLPTVEALNDLAIAGLPQNTTRATYSERAAMARRRRDLTLGILTTDAARDGQKGTLPTGPFNVGAPRGETLFTRLRSCRQKLDQNVDLRSQVDATLSGRGTRVDINGLGFDYRRIAASVPGEGAKKADPVVECLCFYGLLVHPVGGDGNKPRQRGWAPKPSDRHAFRWPVWEDQLDQWAIDSLLDVVYADSDNRTTPHTSGLPERWKLIGVAGLYGTVSFQGTGASDSTRGYATERLA